MKVSQTNQILLGHGSGGVLSRELIKNLFIKYFNNDILINQSDSSTLVLLGSTISFTTDSFVVDPIFFPGGDIGKLAVCGTVNDLAVSGAKPLYLSAGFIIEEGFPMNDLEKIVVSMAEEAKKAGVIIVTGDTKVVNKGQCDKIFINTSGIGLLPSENIHIGKGTNIQPGDIIIVNGSLGDHGMAIISERNDLNLTSNIKSDCASLNGLISEILEVTPEIKFMRDATRGGLATVLCEIIENKYFGLEVYEEKLSIEENVQGMCELLGFDPLYVANEGKVVIVVAEKDANKVLQIMKNHPLGKKSSIIGNITGNHPGRAWLRTSIGGKRIIDMLAGEQLPRIC